MCAGNANQHTAYFMLEPAYSIPVTRRGTIMNIDHHFSNDVLVIDVPDGQGRLSDGNIEDYIADIVRLPGLESGTVALNLSMKSYLNSSGLSDLIKIKESLTSRGIETILISPTQRVMTLLDMAGVDRFFNIISSENQL
ncbi:MAG: anti-sigma factor antagonist [Chrysiogenales bacterium]|nr:MAG: anti-sigma factor antagonist [Chrysiogenales bacterium]